MKTILLCLCLSMSQSVFAADECSLPISQQTVAVQQACAMKAHTNDPVSSDEISRTVCHQRLLLKNLKDLQRTKAGRSPDTAPALKDMITQVNQKIAKTGSTVDMSQCKEKKLEQPITIDPDTGQLVISNTEEF